MGGNQIPTVVDMEAGLEHLSRGTIRHVDLALIVVEPYFKSMETGARMNVLARELGIPGVLTVANKVRSAADSDALNEFCRRRNMQPAAEIPYDESFLEAERAGRAPLDHQPEGAGVQALAALAKRLLHNLH